jgi:hypothetical protein
MSPKKYGFPVVHKEFGYLLGMSIVVNIVERLLEFVSVTVIMIPVIAKDTMIIVKLGFSMAVINVTLGSILAGDFKLCDV